MSLIKIREPDCVGRQRLTVTNAAVVTLTLPNLASPPDEALFRVANAAIAVTVDGTNPVNDGSVGDVMNAPGHFRVTTAKDLAAFKCIGQSATNSAVEVTYFKFEV